MSNELRDQIEQLIYYYDAHSMEEWIDGNDQHLKHFVTEDFTKLLTALKKELINV